MPEVGYPLLFEAEILREHNKLDEASSLREEAVSLCQQTASVASPLYALFGAVILLRISLSRGNLDAAYSALQQVQHVGMKMNQPTYSYFCSHFTIIDQIRLWIACGELDRALVQSQRRHLGM